MDTTHCSYEYTRNFYATYSLANQTVAPTLSCFQGIKRCVRYLDSYPHKPIFNSSNSYYESNVIRFTWSGNQVEDYTNQNFLEGHQDVYHAITLNRSQVLFIL